MLLPRFPVCFSLRYKVTSVFQLCSKFLESERKFIVALYMTRKDTSAMTAVLIPPSPQPECDARAVDTAVNKKREITHSIVQKVHKGTEEITSKDLLQLDAAINTGAVDHIPLVNREYIKSCDSNPQVLVRYIGMVQDMLEPEYFVTKVNGIHTKYREYYSLTDGDRDSDSDEMEDEIAMNHLLEERQPLVLVPIPHSTAILRDYTRNLYGMRSMSEMITEEAGQSGSGDVNEEKLEASTGSRKRRLDETEDDEVRERNDLTKRHSDSSENQALAGKGCSWWPQGCMNSDPGECPVLAKLYYAENEENRGASASAPLPKDKLQSQPRLQLNDVVEVYGILSLDPLGASFEDQQSDGKPSSSRLDLAAQQETFLHDFMDHLIVPPPSQLPRLHVLNYNKLDLDELMAKAQTTHGQHVKEAKDHEMEECKRKLVIDTFAQNIFDGDKIASEAMLMLCMSLAERDYRDSKVSPKTIQMPSGASLGCGSLHFSLSTTENCALLQERLKTVLNDVVPVLANINLSLSSLNGRDTDMGIDADVVLKGDCRGQGVITAPGKNAYNRLDPSILQLPKGSSLIVNQAALTEGSVNQRGLEALASLSKMTRTHTVPYKFDGLMEIDFEADLRIIAISSNDAVSSGPECVNGSRLLPCSMAMNLNLAYNSDDITMRQRVPGVHAISSDAIFQIRRYLSKCRVVKSVTLPKAVLDRAQKDFIKWRKNGMPALSRDVEELDFHRWLLLTRLQARSRIGTKSLHVEPDNSIGECFEAEIQDWENAVYLDCKMSRSTVA